MSKFVKGTVVSKRRWAGRLYSQAESNRVRTSRKNSPDPGQLPGVDTPQGKVTLGAIPLKPLLCTLVNRQLAPR